MRVSDIRVGKIIWLVNSVSKSISKFTVKEIRLSEGLRGMSRFAHGENVGASGYMFTDDCFSLLDYNIIANGYNHHQSFFTPQAAKRYQRKIGGTP